MILPLSLDVFRLNLVAKYLTYAFVALGLVLCWGYGGILSLGQGVFFGLGGYCMAMFLKLEASSPANTKIQSTPGIPDFMDWNQITALPLFWQPFHSLTLTILAIIAGARPASPSIIGAAMFKRRVGGIYFAIITQAIAAILTILIIGQQGYTGGINGMTDLRTLRAGTSGPDQRQDHPLLRRASALLFGCIVHRASSSGTDQARPHPGGDARQGGSRPLLRLQRRQLQDLRLLPGRGASPRSAARMFTLQVGFMSPSFVGIVPSIEMVIYAAVGGRHVDPGRGVRHAAGQLRQDQPLGILPAAVAVPARRTVHRASCWLSRTVSPASGRTHVQPRIDRLLASRKPKSGAGWSDSSVADGAPAE